jgi:ribosomal protein S18 acetylase RimI-like enzyme
LKAQIYEGFSRHAIAMTGHDGLKDPIVFVAMDNEMFAGAVAIVIFWGALHIKYVYVSDAYRHQGLGTRLMDYAIEYGKKNNCPFAFVETMNFQALEFYKKIGFKLEFSRTGYSYGTSFHYLRKDLLPQQISVK